MNHRHSMTVLLLCFAAGSAHAAEGSVSFCSDIAPLLLDNCLACHGAKKAEGGYRVDSYSELLKVGDSGESPIATDPNDASELLRRISCTDESERMPAESEPLAAEQVATIQKWIAEGAKFDGDDPARALELVIPPVQYAAPADSYAHPLPITAVAFSPDGKFVIASGYHELTIWDTEKAALVRRIRNIGQRVFAICFSPDGNTLAVGGGEPGKSGEVRLVNFATGEIQGVVARTNDIVLDVAYRPAAPELAVAAADSTIRIINTQTLTEVRTIASHADWVTSVAWSDDGTILASGSRDKSAKAYDAATGNLLSTYAGHGAAVRAVSVLPENKQVVSVGADNKLHRWDIAEAKKTAEIPLGGEGQKALRRADQLFVPCTDTRLLQIDLKENKIAQEFKGHGDWVLTTAEQPEAIGDPNNRLLVSGSFDGELRLWNESDGTLIRSWMAKP